MSLGDRIRRQISDTGIETDRAAKLALYVRLQGEYSGRGVLGGKSALDDGGLGDIVVAFSSGERLNMKPSTLSDGSQCYVAADDRTDAYLRWRN